MREALHVSDSEAVATLGALVFSEGVAIANEVRKLSHNQSLRAPASIYGKLIQVDNFGCITDGEGHTASWCPSKTFFCHIFTQPVHKLQNPTV